MNRAIQDFFTSLDRIWMKLTWTYRPKSEREAGDAIVRNLLLHWFPAKTSRRSLSWSYSFWLGTISAALFLLLCVTGGILMFLYVPSVERAYGSVKDLEYVISFGWFLRGSHRMAAHLMVAVVFFHMVRVFLTGAYKNGAVPGANRPVNWIIGVLLLLATLLLSFTGYLLPWDQLAYWAVTVGTNIARAAPVIGESVRFVLLGGNEIAQNTLLRFYVLHCFLLPTVVLFLFSYHMWRVRKDGGLAVVDQESFEQKKEEIPPVKSKTYTLLGIAGGTSVHVRATAVAEDADAEFSSPHLLRRILVVSLLTITVVSIFTVLFRAPLEAPANPSVTPNPAKAPWYFLWLQELVADTTIQIGSFTISGSLVGGILVPGLLVLLLALWPYFDRSPVNAVGVWFHRERRKQNAVFIVVCAVILLLTFVGTYMRGPYWNFYWPWERWPELPVKF